MRYEIKTLDDILNCVNSGNVENFIKDFSDFLNIYVAGVTVARIVPAAEGKKNTEIIQSEKFIWIDDGKNDKKITIHVSGLYPPYRGKER
jgi:hypothetical protein